MTGKTSVRRTRVPETAVGIALVKESLGFKSTVPIAGSSAEVYVKGGGGKLYHNKNPVVVVRKIGRGGPTITSKPARALKACGGKKGEEFKTCVRSALIHAPAAFAADYVAQPKRVAAHAELAGSLR